MVDVRDAAAHEWTVQSGVRADDAVRMLKLFYAQENPNAPEAKRKPARSAANVDKAGVS